AEAERDLPDHQRQQNRQQREAGPEKIPLPHRSYLDYPKKGTDDIFMNRENVVCPLFAQPRARRLAGLASSMDLTAAADAAGFFATARLAFRASRISTTFSCRGPGVATTSRPSFLDSIICRSCSR